VFDLVVGAEEAGAVDLDVGAVAHEAEFDGEPEEPGEGAGDGFEGVEKVGLGGDGLDVCGCEAGKFAEADEDVGEGAVGVHGYVANDVVEDVGLGEVVERGGVADGDGGGEGALAATVEEDVGGR